VKGSKFVSGFKHSMDNLACHDLQC